MKAILLFSILFSAIAVPVLGELTLEDIEKINAKIKTSEDRTQKHVTQEIENLKTPVAWLIGILVAVIALIGIPLVIFTIMIGGRSVQDNAQAKQIETLTQEIETLKQQQIVRP